MPNIITQSAARTIIAKIDAAKVPLAVFKVGHGSWQATRTNTEFCSIKLRQRPDQLIGFYDCNVRLADLCEDLEAMGIN